MSRVKRYKPKKNVVKPAQADKWLTKKKIWTFIIAGLMVASVFGIMLGSYSDTPNKKKYGNYVFKKSNLGWTIKINDQVQTFQYHPADVELLEIDQKAVDLIRGSQVVYITFNPGSQDVQTSDLLRFELTKSLTEIFGIYAMQGVTRMNESYNLPYITCANSTAMVPVIYITASEDPELKLEGSCVLLKADKNTAMAIKDRLIYGMLGILDENSAADARDAKGAVDGAESGKELIEQNPKSNEDKYPESE